MICPNCKQESYCGCRSCLKRRRRQLDVLEIWIDKELGIIACGHCRFAMISAAWFSMECDMYLEPLMSLEEAILKYRPQGKMPHEKNYKASIRAHWGVKLGRWRGLLKHALELIIGHGTVYKKTRWKTIKAQFAKL